MQLLTCPTVQSTRWLGGSNPSAVNELSNITPSLRLRRHHRCWIAVIIIAFPGKNGKTQNMQKLQDSSSGLDCLQQPNLGKTCSTSPRLIT